MNKKVTKLETRPSELGVDKPEVDRRESSLNHHAGDAEITKVQKNSNSDKHKRIIISGINSLVGHGLFE